MNKKCSCRIQVDTILAGNNDVYGNFLANKFSKELAVSHRMLHTIGKYVQKVIFEKSQHFLFNAKSTQCVH